MSHQLQRISDVFNFLRHRGPTATWAVLALSIFATLLTAWVVNQSRVAEISSEFEVAALRISDEIADVMSTYQQILRTGAGLFNSKQEVSEQDWRAFVENLEVARNFPGVQALGFSKVIEKADLGAHIERMRLRIALDYDIRPAGDRDLYSSIIYLEPQNWRNSRAIGYDMFSEPARRAAMEVARDTAEPNLTRGVRLVQETQADQQSGVLMYQPVFTVPGRRLTVDERRTKLIGYIYAAFRMTDLIERAVRTQLPALLEGVTLRIYDADRSKGGVLLYDSGTRSRVGRATDEPVQTAGGLTTTRPLMVAGQTWYLEFLSTTSFGGRNTLLRPWVALLIGSLISAMITAIAATLAMTREQALVAKEKLSAEMAVRIEAETQVSIANQELIHRVKNLMAVVSSIAAQTAKFSPNPMEFTTQFRERLAALGRVHDLLKPNPAFMPELDHLVREILAPYVDTRQSVLTCAGPSVVVSQSAAVMLSLVINEFAANSLKYGAWSVLNGNVALKWWVESGDDNEMIVMLWEELNGPAVAPPTHKGFGTNVLKFAIENGLRGSYEPIFKEGGFICLLRFPTPHGARSGSEKVQQIY